MQDLILSRSIARMLQIAKGLQDAQIRLEDVQRMRGHTLTPTCVALSPDDAAIYTGSKDNSIVRWDVNTGKRVVIAPQWRKVKGGKVPETKAHSKEVGLVLCTSLIHRRSVRHTQCSSRMQ